MVKHHFEPWDSSFHLQGVGISITSHPKWELMVNGHRENNQTYGTVEHVMCFMSGLDGATTLVTLI
jgi:hypothetical protein